MPSNFQTKHAGGGWLGAGALVLLASVWTGLSATDGSYALAERFRNPPDASRMTTYWIWIGPAVTAEQVDRDLVNMKAAGIGGVVLLPIYPLSPDDPDRGIRNLPYLSPEFLEVVAYAAGRARELGLTFDLTLGTGWPSGGPSVTPDHAARRITMAEIPLAPDRRTLQLPEPPEGEQLEAVFLRSDGSFRELPLPEDRTIVLPADASAGTVAVFASSGTGQMVKRPALGAEGLVVDHLSADALRHYLDVVGERLAAAVHPSGVRAYWIDSLEVYGGNWTPRFLEQFQERRGYDLRPLLPRLFSGPLEDTVHLRYDFWRTVSELAETEFLKPLQQWAHAKGALLQAEPYGQPPVSLSSLRYVDLPLGEHYEWKMFNACRWTASGAWLFGRRVIGAEAYTWLGVPNRFGDTLEQMKSVSDMHFLSGINALMAVSYILTPPAAHLAEWSPYWGPVFNDQQTWWDYFPLLSRYVQRVSDVLRQGVPVADVALFLPGDDAFAHAEMTGVPIEGTTGIRFERGPAPESPSFTGMNLYFAVRDMLHGGRIPEFGIEHAFSEASPLIETIVTNGYSFGGIDSFTVSEMRIEGARLRAGLADYAVIVLPGLQGMRLDALEKIADFCRQGGIVIATRRLPATAYGWQGRAENTARLRALVGEMFGTVQGRSATENRYGAGRAIFVDDETTGFLEALEAALQPDIRFRPADPDVSFVHRRTAGGDFYFVTNLSTEWKDLQATFRVQEREPEFWDPMTGGTRRAIAYRWVPGGTQVPIRLEPYGAIIVFFGESARPARVESTNLHDLRSMNGTLIGRAVRSGTYFISTGPVRSEQRIDLPPPLPMHAPWRFSTEDDQPEQFTMESLASWTEFSSTRFFAGRGVYRTDLEVPARYLRGGIGLHLDLGAVREIADVRVNGRPAGVAWKRPYVIDVTAHLRPGRNRIEVGVTNLLINRLLGSDPPSYEALRREFGERFPDPQEWTVVAEPFPSGLLGPVRLVPYAELRFEWPADARSDPERAARMLPAR